MTALTTFVNALPGNISQGLIWGVLAIGVFITYKILDFPDLTVDGSLGTGGAVAVMLITNGVPVPIALIAAFISGCLAGLITGLLNALLGIPGILAGILTQLALYSVYLDIMGKSNRPVSVDKYPLLVSQRYVMTQGNELIIVILEVLKIIVIVGILIAALYWFFGTELGCALRATGSNSSMSRAQGINTDTTKVLGLMLSNGLVALSGALLAQYQGSATIDMGRGAIVIGLAAVIIGQVLLSRIFHNFSLKLLSAVIGAIIYYMVIQVVLRLGLDPNDLKLLTALVVAVFLSIPYWKDRYFTKAVRKGGPVHA